MKFRNPIEIMRMIMALMHALCIGHLTVVWTDHGAMRAMERKELPTTTKKIAEHRRPFVLDLNTASWYLTNKDESLFLVVSDKLFGRFVLHYAAETNKKWVVVTAMTPSMFRSRKYEVKTDSLPELLSQITLKQIEQEAPEEPVETPLDEVIEDTTEDSDVVDESLSDADYDDDGIEALVEAVTHEVDEALAEAAQEGLRNNAIIHLNQLPHKSLLQLRKHLKITGNGTGKRGVVTKEWAVQSILDFMDARKDYSFEF